MLDQLNCFGFLWSLLEVRRKGKTGHYSLYIINYLLYIYTMNTADIHSVKFILMNVVTDRENKSKLLRKCNYELLKFEEYLLI